MERKFENLPEVKPFLENKTDLQYHSLLHKILTEGVKKEDRTGTGTISIIGPQIEFNLQDGFPLITTKKLHTKSIFHELLWFIKGETNVKYLQENEVRIWNEWADENGELGPVYGKQWRKWLTPSGNEVDQLGKVIRDIKENPYSRRHLVSAWNVGDLDKMALEPCHLLYQFFVHDDKLSCKMYQRSADVFLGVPFNIASYATLTHLVAQVTDYKPGNLIISFGDAHLYLNHIKQAETQLERTPYPMPRLRLNPNIKNIDDFKYADFTVENYKFHPYIPAPISV